ncbi:MAG: hypothetical protein OEY67_05550 [Gammaproteobacteria bacterium]|nr:hypothetical protein [Gammaproteobacteria bacterium]
MVTRLLLWCAMTLYVNASIQAGEGPEPATSGKLSNASCIDCHSKTDPSVVSDWEASAHSDSTAGKVGPRANCVDCHGNVHAGVAELARKDSRCITCHGGSDAPVNRSYFTSKHGIIFWLEKNDWDWSQPLSQANYRSPGCSYCHMHQGKHNVGKAIITQASITEDKTRVIESMQPVCQDCHSPRYISRLSENGERMLEIGRMKWREATNVIDRVRTEIPEADFQVIEQLSVTMKTHLTNLRLGIAHQSPDYQWWHGQPALDGDLLRIKGEVSRLRRERLIRAGE